MNELALLAEMRTGNPMLTMSSREIAEITGARHDNVKITIQRLAEKGAMPLPALQEVNNIGHGPTSIHIYQLDKRSSLIVVAQLCPVFLGRIIDRWQQLEVQAQTQSLALPDFTDPVKAARAWADEVEAKQRAEYQAAELAIENKKLLPRAHVAEQIAESQGNHTMAEAAKILGTGRNKLFLALRAAKVLNTFNVPYQDYMDRGYFKTREFPIMIDGISHLNTQTLVTGKGLCWLTKIISSQPQLQLEVPQCG